MASSLSSIGGLVSGLDTDSVISSLLSIEKQPQTALVTKQTAVSTLKTALQTLNTKTASLTEFAQKVAKSSSWNAYTATSSDTSVTATASSSAQVTSLSFRVDKVAASQSSVIDLGDGTDLTSLLGSSGSMTVKKADGTTTTITPKSSSLTELVSAINSSDAGVRATVVSTTSKAADGTTTTSKKLQLTGTETGTDNAFTVYQGADTSTAVNTTSVRAASDAQITLWSGTGAEQTVTNDSNTFDDLVSGLSFTVTKVTADDDDDVTISVGQDTAALTKFGSGLVEQLNLVLNEISGQSQTTTTTDSDGNTTVKGGTLSGNSTVRLLQESLQEAGSYDVDGVSPSTIGLTIASDGTFSFDEDAFTTALASDPQKVQKLLQGIADRVGKVGDEASDSISGTLTQAVTSQQSQYDDLQDQIDAWTTRLSMREETLRAQFTAMETSLSKLSSTSSYLTTALASLSTSDK